MNTFENKIRVLEHLSYVLECVAAEIPREAKYELGRLIDSIKENTVFQAGEKAELVAELTKASEYLQDRDCRRAGSYLGARSRGLWKQILRHLDEDSGKAIE